MQEKKLCEGQELICINVDKVYDWIVKENSFDFALPTGDIVFTPTTSVPTTAAGLVGATIRCEVTPATSNPIVITNRQDRPFCIDGKNVLLQQLNIRKNFVVTLIVTLANGTVLTGTPTPTLTPTVNTNLLLSRCEQVSLCAPEGTNVEVTFTDLDCFVCSPGVLTIPPVTVPPAPVGSITITGLTISIATCQSIQSTFPVTVEFLADFCEPRDDLPTTCPSPMRPKQCSVIFPDDGHGHGHGNCCH